MNYRRTKAMRRDYGISINWEEVHAISHGLHDNPHHILGPHLEGDGLVINAFVKNALKVEVIREDKKDVLEMRASGIADFFTLSTDDKKIFPYKLRATYRDGSVFAYKDAYCFEPVIDNQELASFSQGILYDAYDIMGAHKKTIDGVSGVCFTVWAPNAQRVSVLGEFNMWEGNRNIMRRVNDTAVFELFVPGVNVGDTYKFEIRNRDGRVFTKTDPYSFSNEIFPSDVSKVVDPNFKFKDSAWIKARDKKKRLDKPMNVLEINPFTFDDTLYDRNFKTLAKSVADYAIDNGYSHVELMPIMDTINGDSLGYETHGFYSVSAVLGQPEDFMYFVDYMHNKGIGVILDWAPYQFGRERHGLAYFDGDACYEDSNMLRAVNRAFGTLNFNYGRKEVSNFLISNALYWVERFHVDGLKLSSVASMLYLDYGKNDGEWLPNIYGSNENLDAIEFIKHLNSIMNKRNPGVIMIAEDSSLFPDVTVDVEEDGLGFDYKWNLGWSNDMLGYAETDVVSRRNEANALTFSLLYAYNENYMYGISHSDVVFSKPFIDKIAGNDIQKKAFYKAWLGYMMTQPGKKYFYDDGIKDDDLVAYKKALFELYNTEPAFSELDYDDVGFEWINTLRAKDGLLVFTRKTKKKDDTLVFVVNFSPEDYQSFMIGVPYKGKYKEIFNSDSVDFGGDGNVNSRMRQSQDKACDERSQSITTTIPPFGISVYKYNVSASAAKTTKKTTKAETKAVEEETKEEVKKTATKTTAKKATAKKATTTKKAAAKKETTAKKAAPKKETAAKKETTAKKTTAKKEATPKKETVAKKASDTAKKASDTVKKASDTVKKTAVKKASDTKKKASDTAKKASDTVKKAKETVKKTTSKSAKKTEAKKDEE
jgi:1,4-alpha-glucan branching enzyme